MTLVMFALFLSWFVTLHGLVITLLANASNVRVCDTHTAPQNIRRDNLHCCPLVIQIACHSVNTLNSMLFAFLPYAHLTVMATTLGICQYGRGDSRNVTRLFLVQPFVSPFLGYSVIRLLNHRLTVAKCEFSKEKDTNYLHVGTTQFTSYSTIKSFTNTIFVGEGGQRHSTFTIFHLHL